MSGNMSERGYFILVEVMEESILGKLEVRWEYILDWMQEHYKQTH